jgi:hypothetical protein
MNATRTRFVGACLLAAVVPVVLSRAAGSAGAGPALRANPDVTTDVTFAVLARTHLRGRPLTPLPLSPLEQRFAADFPGTVARYRAGDATLIVRQVAQPTRKLHPSIDCFRAAGYAVGAMKPHAEADDVRWTCFEARQGAQRWRVCERFFDTSGRQWTDVSGWYWSAMWAQRSAHGAGPWWAVTIASPVDPQEET